MGAFLLSLAASVGALQPAQAGNPSEIIVTGQRLGETGAALRECLARGCPVTEDIDASIAHAEAQLIAGEYREARSTLQGSLSRNKRHARAFPEPVSDLLRANARVASHLGIDGDYEYSTEETYRVLKGGIQQQDHRHFIARLEIAAMTARLKGHDRARRIYADIAKDARRAGRPGLAAIAEVHAVLAEHRHAVVNSGAPPSAGALARLRAYSESSDPAEQAAGMMASAVLARFARERGDEAESDRLLARVAAAAGGASPSLIYSPNFKLVQRELPHATDMGNYKNGNVLKRIAPNMEDQWVDVEFWIQPDGRVGDVAVIREDGETGWAEPLLKAIAGRLYSRPANGTPVYKLERYTYTSGYEVRTGSRLAQRSPMGRIEYLDLTNPAAGRPR